MKAYCFDACQSEFKSNQRRKRFANLLFYCKRISITFMVRRCVQQWSICGICVETHFDIFATMWMWWLNCTLNWVDFLDCIHFDVLLNLDNAEHSNTQHYHPNAFGYIECAAKNSVFLIWWCCNGPCMCIDWPKCNTQTDYYENWMGIVHLGTSRWAKFFYFSVVSPHISEC